MVADTIPDPRTVMVHLGNANVADAAVVSALGLPVAASLAVHLFIRRWCLRDDFGLFESCHCIREQRHEDQEVEEDLNQLAVYLVGHPFIHFVVHQVDRHRVEDNNDESHHEYESPRDHVVSKEAAEQAVTEHAHFRIVKTIIITKI